MLVQPSDNAFSTAIAVAFAISNQIQMTYPQDLEGKSKAMMERAELIHAMAWTMSRTTEPKKNASE